MSHNGKTSYKLFEAGTNRDGWFTNNDLIKQFEEFAGEFAVLHPGKELYFGFDNSMTHRAKATNGLDVTKLNLSDGGKNTPELRNGWYIKDGHRVEHIMKNADGVQKGIRTILLERGKWHDKLLKICKPCTNKVPISERKAGGYYVENCCATTILSRELDFVEQRDALTEAVENSGHKILFYPKYHCELNYIENDGVGLSNIIAKTAHMITTN